MSTIQQLNFQPANVLGRILTGVLDKNYVSRTTQKIKTIEGKGIYIVTQHQLIDEKGRPHFQTKPTMVWNVGGANLARHDATSHAFSFTGTKPPGELANAALMQALLDHRRAPLDSPVSSEMREFPGLYETLLTETKELVATRGPELVKIFHDIGKQFDSFWMLVTDNGSSSPKDSAEHVFQCNVSSEHLSSIWSSYERAFNAFELTVWDMFEMNSSKNGLR